MSCPVRRLARTLSVSAAAMHPHAYRVLVRRMHSTTGCASLLQHVPPLADMSRRLALDTRAAHVGHATMKQSIALKNAAHMAIPCAAPFHQSVLPAANIKLPPQQQPATASASPVPHALQASLTAHQTAAPALQIQLACHTALAIH